MASAPVALGLGGVASVLIISGIQGKAVGDIISGDFGPALDPKGPGTSSGLGESEGQSPATGSAPTGNLPPRIQKMVTWCNSVSGQYPYAWGGGHASIGFPSMGGLNGPSGKKVNGFDCSGAVSGALHAAGLLNHPLTSGELAAGWGAPGPGKIVTVYANPVHTFMRIGNAWFGTGHIGKGGGGPAWGNHDSTSGYVPKHWPGL
jgi:hypothetical protein